MLKCLILDILINGNNEYEYINQIVTNLAQLMINVTDEECLVVLHG